jgi:hypothetical protein
MSLGIKKMNGERDIMRGFFKRVQEPVQGAEKQRAAAYTEASGFLCDKPLPSDMAAATRISDLINIDSISTNYRLK